MTQFVFELVDCSDDETYFSIGIFLSLEDAIAAVDASDNPRHLLCNEVEGVIELKVRRRSIGLSGHGKSVWSRKWTQDWTDEDAPKWKETV